jgi:predicted nucleotidyltransferase
MNENLMSYIIEESKSAGIKKLLIFGSALTEKNPRDIDLAYDGIEFWDALKLAAKLENKIGKTIDLIPLHPETDFINYIKSKAVVLYES